MRKEQVISTTNNNQMEEKGMKSRFIHLKKRFVPALSGALMGVMLMSTTCFAAGDTSAVTQPLENLKTLIIAVIGAVGVIILAKNVMEFAQAYQQQDS
ncbi:electron transporter RnfA, partial [Roseburia faecis]|uniref:electron transporter RnfA n=1 Tax=Roseburia faecis TaxID=301302 RepID=UPI0018A92974